jgi:hypothetical protein
MEGQLTFFTILAQSQLLFGPQACKTKQKNKIYNSFNPPPLPGLGTCYDGTP